MRYIDADELKRIKFHPLPYTHITPSGVDSESYKRGWNDAIDVIVDNEPTADVRENVRGEWQKVDEQPYFRKHFHKVCCSVCRKQGYDYWNFCPNCGADMRGR